MKEEHHPRSSPFYKRKWFIAVCIAVVIGFFLLFFIRTKLAFFLDDELRLVLRPLDLHLTTVSGGSRNATFTLTNDNFRQCSSTCSLELWDLSAKKRIEGQNVVMQHGQKLEQSYVFEAPKYGEGQVLYRLEVSCQNIKSILCPTTGEKRSASSLILLKYTLGEEDKKAQGTLQGMLAPWFSALSESNQLLMQNTILANRLPPAEYDLYLPEIMEQNRTHAVLLKAKDDTTVLWDSYAYNELAATFNQDLPAITMAHREQLIELQNQFMIILSDGENNRKMIESITQRRSDIAQVFSHYQKNTGRQNALALQSLIYALSEVYDEFLVLERSSTTVQSDIRMKLEDAARRIDSQLQGYENQQLKGRFLLTAGKRLVREKNSTSLNISDAVCKGIDETAQILDRENNAALAFREFHYLLTLGNQTIDHAIGALSDEMIKKAAEEAQLAVPMFKNDVLVINASSRSNVSVNISEEDLHAMTIIDPLPFSEYVRAYCQDPSINVTFTNETLELFMMVNSSSLKMQDITLPDVAETVFQLQEAAPICCLEGMCEQCCDDCSQNKENYPVLFIHGHAFNEQNTPAYSMNSFTKLQEHLEEEGIINGGELDVLEVPLQDENGVWKTLGRPVSVRASYYYITHYDVGGYTISTQKSERIENYALRLREIIDGLKYKTGSPKVKIVAHSMGGLVVREYLQLFGAGSVDTVVTINTPHHGVGEKQWKACRVLGSEKECDDMKEGSIFLSRLNENQISMDVAFYAIRSSGCPMDSGMGDGVVTDASSYLEGAENIVINGTCTDALGTDLHSAVLDPDLYPETYEILKTILKKS